MSRVKTRTKLLPFLVAVFLSGAVLAADEAAKEEAPSASGGWKITKITIPKTGQIEHAYVNLLSPEGRAFTLTPGVKNKEAGVVLEKVEWTGSPVRARVVLRKETVRSEASAGAALVSRDDSLERRLSQVEIESKFIELPDAQAAELLPSLKKEGSPGADKLSLLTEVEAARLITAMQQQKGVDVLSAPRVTMNSGQDATIEIIREFRYPTEWEPTDAKNKHWKPTAFETKNVGVTLQATATVNHDETLDLHLVPQVVEFLGFVEAGTQKAIGAAVKDAKEPLTRRMLDAPVKPNEKDPERKSPVFATRKTESDLALRAGQSVVLALGAAEDTKPFPPPHAGRTLIAIVTAKLIDPENLAPALQPPAPAPAVGDLPVATPVQGKPGFVVSPYAPYEGLVDVRGFPSGTEVQDPYVRDKRFRVP